MRNGIENPTATTIDPVELYRSIAFSLRFDTTLQRSSDDFMMVGLGVGWDSRLVDRYSVRRPSQSNQYEDYLEKVNRRVKDALSDVLPKSWR